MGGFFYIDSVRGAIGLERFGRHALTFAIIGIICYAGLAFTGRFREFREALESFPLSWIPPLLALAALNYLLRYLRWHIYMKTLGVNIGYWRDFKIFMAGLAMSVTPGKAGEALKAHLLRKDTNKPWSVGLPAVFAERLTDLMGVVILVILGLSSLPIGRGVAVLGMVICIGFFLVFSRPAFLRPLIRLIGKIPGMANRCESLLEMQLNVHRLLSLRLLFVSLGISVVAWFSECLVLYYALIASGGESNLMEATFVYALSTLAGAFSLLPGGLIVTEGSMAGLLRLFGVELTQGALVTLIVRLCTLWFAVFIGMIFFFLCERGNPLKAVLGHRENGSKS